MALSGTFSASIRDGKYKLRVDWAATQNVANNTSKIACTMYLVQESSWSLAIIGRDDNTVTINGVTRTWSSPAINNGGGKTTKLASVTSGDIAHNADGTKTVTLSAVFNIRATILGTYYDQISASTTVTLDTIPRATTPTLSASSADMGSKVTINTPRASSSFTHDLAYQLGSGSWVSIATGVGTSYSWTVPDVASQLPNATSGQLTVRCITKNGSTTIGTKTAKLVARVPASVVPTVGTVTVAEATTGLAAQFGAYIQSKSKLQVSISASGAKGSTITAYSTTLAGKTYTGNSWTSDVLTGKGSISLVTKVKDSRGRWSAGKTTTITVLAYATPQVTTLRAYRVVASGAADEQGEYIAVQYRYSVTALGDKNTAAMTIAYKRSTATTWSTLLTGTALSEDTTAKPSTPTFSVDYQYDVRITVTDWFGATRTYTTTLPSGAVIIDLLASGKGVAIGKTAEQEGIDLGWGFVGGVSSIGSQAGRWKMPKGPLVQWGVVNITPTAANEATTEVVTFPVVFAASPVVFVTAISAAPETVSLSILRTVSVVGDPKEGVGIVLTRPGTTTTGVQWLAIGPG